MPTRGRPIPVPAAVPACARCPHRGQGMFRDAPPRALAALDRGRRPNRFFRGQILYSEGNTPVAAYCVQAGRIKLYHLAEDGRQHVLRVAGPGSLLGAANLLSDIPYGETAEAIEPALACLLDAAALRSLFLAEPRLWERLTRSLCLQAARVQGNLLRRAHNRARSKMAGLLLELAGPRRASCDLPFSRQDLADMIGVSQETAIRVLGEIRRKRAIALRGRRLAVLRRELLEELAGPAF